DADTRPHDDHPHDEEHSPGRRNRSAYRVRSPPGAVARRVGHRYPEERGTRVGTHRRRSGGWAAAMRLGTPNGGLLLPAWRDPLTVVLLTRKRPPCVGWPLSSKRSPAVSYSPTGSPLQYHRRCEA